jgi:multidrug efflux pump subunit AcrA (membrane-fusion protein)
MNYISPSFVLIYLLFSSCSGDKSGSVVTFLVEKADYIEKITVPGTVKAVVNTPVLPPRISQLTVVRLASDGAFVRKGDTICVLESAELESSYKTAITDIETSEAGLKKTEADHKLNISLLEAQLLNSEAQLKISYLDSLKMRFVSEAQQKLLALQIQKAELEKQKIEKKLTGARSIASADIRQKQLQIMQKKVKAQSTADQLKSLTMVAQRDGMVQRAEAPVVRLMSTRGSGMFGGPVKEGTVIMISSPVLEFPDMSRMQISASVSESEFRKIEKDQRAIITVDAAEKLETTGRVNRKSLASGNSQRNMPSRVKTYEVIIDVDSCHSMMKPGLTADCEIFLKEEKDTLFVPSVSIFDRDSIRVVYVKGKRKFNPVQVKTGTAGSSFTVIAAGLKGRENVALTEPPSRLVSDEVIAIDTASFHQ